MCYALRWVPVPAKMDISEREVGGDDQLLTPPGSHHGAVVTNAEGQNSVPGPARRELICPKSNGCNQLSSPGAFARFFARSLEGTPAMAPAYPAQGVSGVNGRW